MIRNKEVARKKAVNIEIYSSTNQLKSCQLEEFCKILSVHDIYC